MCNLRGPKDRVALKETTIGPTLKNWLLVFLWMVPWPSLISAASNLKISFRNLFWEEWIRVRISVLSTSRFFSKKPVKREETMCQANSDFTVTYEERRGSGWGHWSYQEAIGAPFELILSIPPSMCSQ